MIVTAPFAMQSTGSPVSAPVRQRSASHLTGPVWRPVASAGVAAVGTNDYTPTSLGGGGTVPLRETDLFYIIGIMSASTLGTLELTTLLAVARLGDDAYGLAVRRDLAERIGRDYSVGAVYTTLQRLQDKGLLTSRAGEPLPVRGGRARRHFTITGAGARALREAERHGASIWAGVGTIIRPEPA